jgi:outer membrane lipoprotein LolB
VPTRQCVPSNFQSMLWRCLVMVLMLALSACASTPSITVPSRAPDLAWLARKSELEKISSWRLNGRITIKSTEDSWSTAIDWQQQDDAFDILFMTHLGQTVAKLHGRPGRATLLTPDEKLNAANVDVLLNKHFGWVIPVEGMRFWVLGLPAPGLVANKQLDDYGRVSSLEQLGWRIKYVRYTNDGDIDLPEKMVLEYPQLQVRLFIDRWKLSG